MSESAWPLIPSRNTWLGIYLVEQYDTDERAWREFLEVAQAKAQSGTILGFLQALHDCILAKGKEHEIGDYLDDLWPMILSFGDSIHAQTALFVAANPDCDNRLTLEKEAQDIHTHLHMAEHRDAVACRLIGR